MAAITRLPKAPLLRKYCSAHIQIAAKNPACSHKEDMVGAEPAYNRAGMEGIMDGRFDCCRYEPSLEELLADDVMAPVLRSAGFDAQGLRDMMVETARRIDRGTVDGSDKGGN
jgi:hypothetical protein